MKEFRDNELEKKWEDLFLLRSEVNKALEMKRAERFLGNSLEAKMVLYLPEKYKTLISIHRFFADLLYRLSGGDYRSKS